MSCAWERNARRPSDLRPLPHTTAHKGAQTLCACVCEPGTVRLRAGVPGQAIWPQNAATRNERRVVTVLPPTARQTLHHPYPGGVAPGGHQNALSPGRPRGTQPWVGGLGEPGEVDAHSLPTPSDSMAVNDAAPNMTAIPTATVTPCVHVTRPSVAMMPTMMIPMVARARPTDPTSTPSAAARPRWRISPLG
jgi:hypothetical protein